MGIYGFVWGASQLLTGRLSDHIGRLKPIVWGMWLLYPNLSAAVADISHPNWRSSAIGIYRFWRDTGYGIGALGFGLLAEMTGAITSGFWLVSIAMLISGVIVLVLGEETHPRLNPYRPSSPP